MTSRARFAGSCPTCPREATWTTYSFDVRLEGRGACRLTDKMFHNGRNTVNMAGLVQLPPPPLKPSGDEKRARFYKIIYDVIWRIRPPTLPGGFPDGVKGIAWRWQEAAENKGGWTEAKNASHMKEYLEQRDELRERLQQWQNKKQRNCDDDDLPPGTKEYASDQLPELGPGKAIAPQPVTSEFKSYLKGAGVVVAGAATGFIIFEVVTRLIRLIPPLWPLQASPI